MPDMLIRNLPEQMLAEIREAATISGRSLLQEARHLIRKGLSDRRNGLDESESQRPPFTNSPSSSSGLSRGSTGLSAKKDLADLRDSDGRRGSIRVAGPVDPRDEPEDDDPEGAQPGSTLVDPSLRSVRQSSAAILGGGSAWDGLRDALGEGQLSDAEHDEFLAVIRTFRQ